MTLNDPQMCTVQQTRMGGISHNTRALNLCLLILIAFRYDVQATLMGLVECQTL